MLNIAQCTCTHLLRSKAHINWSKNLLISWKSYRYHQYPTSKVYPILSWTFIDFYRQLYRARCQFEIFYDVDSKIVIYPNTGFIGFVVETFQGFHTHLCRWMVGKQPLVSMVFGLANHWKRWFFNGFSITDDGFSMVLVWPTIGTNGFSMVFPLETMVFQWFWVWQTIGTNGFSMVFSLETMVFQWFPMVPNHWSNDGMVTIHRRGLRW